jgi:hypothetical protein
VLAGHLFGVGLLEHRIEAARRSYPTFHCNAANVEQLAFEDCFLNLILIAHYSSVCDADVGRAIANSVVHVLKPDRFVVWWDIRYPNPSNRKVHAVTKRHIKALFPSFELELQRLGLIPPIAQRLGRMTERVYPALTEILVLRSHFFGFLRPRQPSQP